jgi:two-component system, NtrC family, sensor kinase
MFSFLIILLGSIFIRKRFAFGISHPQLDGYLKLAWVLALFAYLSTNWLENNFDLSINLFLYSILAFVFYCYWEVSEKQKNDPIILSTLAFLLVSIVSDFLILFAEPFYEEISSYLNFASLGLFISVITFGIGVSKQQKALLEEKEKNKLTTKRKDELEVLVQERTSEISKQKEDLELTLIELKSTQAQLIQSEKLASLGELTAGIAHEIQNPLNFVNNFSELTEELAQELEVEIEKDGERDLVLEKELLQDIKDNLVKINHHGSRASSIVKNMLEHSRSSSGTKEVIELNKVCDEYLRLSYHGLRAKNKSFNADFKTELDPNVGTIEVVLQDFGRVLLNILNNAFYAVKAKSEQNIDSYKPKVIVSTELLKNENKIKVSIKDNGIGISEENRTKIFQPFFTTKPTGEGTGLGLSLSHDIIGAHGGEIKLDSKLNEGSEFILILPIK